MSLGPDVPVVVARAHERAVGRSLGGFVVGLVLLGFFSVVIGALFLLMSLVGVIYEIVVARSDLRLLEIRAEGLIVYRDFHERHPDGLRVSWADVEDVRLEAATGGGLAPYLTIHLTVAARGRPPLDRFEHGKIRVALVDAEPSSQTAIACIDSYRRRFASTSRLERAGGSR